jgi:hypothetical protein
VSGWGPWSGCSASCGGGTQTRWRSITTHSANNGAACPALSESQSCNTHGCPVNCQVSDWGAWSACSQPCDGGEQTRHKSIVRPDANGGIPCPSTSDLVQKQYCNTHGCGSSCFIADSLILMADFTYKPIQGIKIGDIVLSGKTLEPTQVILCDKSYVDKVNLVGFNNIKPFITEDHTLLSKDNKRIVYNKELSISTKHWDNVDKLDNGSILYKVENKEKKELNVENITLDELRDDYVYNIITSDNSFIINNICVYDNFPEIEKYPIVSLRIFNILEEISKKDNDSIDKIKKYIKCVEDIVNKEKDVEVDINSFEEKLGLFMELCNKKEELIGIADNLWANYFDFLKVY